MDNLDVVVDVDPPAEYFVDGAAFSHRPKTAGPTFLRRGQGGGAGAGAGRNGLGGRHAAKPAGDVMPRRFQPLSAEASRYVATKPPSPATPKAGAFKPQPAASTNFKTWYDRGDLPCRVNGGTHRSVRWHVGPIEGGGFGGGGGASDPYANPYDAAVLGALDTDASRVGGRQLLSRLEYEPGGPEYERAKLAFLRDPSRFPYEVFLPLFFEGLRESKEPYRFLAEVGTKDLLAHATYRMVAPCVPLLALPLRLALNTRDPPTVRRAIHAIRQLLAVPADGRPRADGTRATVGELLTPYYRHWLPVFNLFKANRRLLDKHDYSEGLVELMDETMVLMARCGGPDAVREINRVVPLFHLPPRQVPRGVGGVGGVGAGVGGVGRGVGGGPKMMR